MYYQTNQYQNQNQANYLQNQAIPVTNNSPQVIAQNQQYQYPGYAQQNQIATQPQYQKVQAAQNAKNVQQIQNAPNYQNVQQAHHQRQQPLTNNQNIQYYQVPGKPNNYVQYAQPGQQVYPQQVQQIPQVQQGQNMKYNYNIKTNVPDGKQQIRGQGQLLPNQNVNQIKQDPNLVQNIQVANQMGQPQQQKMMLRGPAPKNKHLTGSHKPSTKAPTLDPILAQQQPNTHIINNPNQQINNQNYINQTVNPNAHIHQNQKKVEPKMQIPGQEQKLDKTNKKASLMTVNSLAGLPYKNYPQVEFSSKPFLRISGYACNSYNGTIKAYNEDKIKIQYKVSKNFVLNNKQYQALISYFGVFDGHGGDKCSQFLKENLDRILFNQTMFPNNVIESIREAFKSAESKFRSIAVQNNKLIDKSGSCALIALIINDILYAINLGDSRGLYSKDGGKEFYQITRDHKPNDPKEKARIEKAGGQVYYANKVNVNGKEVILKEEQFGPGFKFPYRLYPSGLAVSFIYNFNIFISLGSKNYRRLLFKRIYF